MIINRSLSDKILDSTPPKAVVLLGARQVGKSFWLRQHVFQNEFQWFDGDKLRHVALLETAYQDSDLKTVLDRSPVLVISDAQKVPHIGEILKTLVDANENCKIFVTASSSLNLAKSSRESAVGRLVAHNLWPISLKELADFQGF